MATLMCIRDTVKRKFTMLTEEKILLISGEENVAEDRSNQAHLYTVPLDCTVLLQKHHRKQELCFMLVNMMNVETALKTNKTIHK